jgi:hypothetical protein
MCKEKNAEIRCINQLTKINIKMTNVSTRCNRLIQIVPKYRKTIKAAPRHANTKDNANLQNQHDTSQELITYAQSA